MALAIVKMSCFKESCTRARNQTMESGAVLDQKNWNSLEQKFKEERRMHLLQVLIVTKKTGSRKHTEMIQT